MTNLSPEQFVNPQRPYDDDPLLRRRWSGGWVAPYVSTQDPLLGQGGGSVDGPASGDNSPSMGDGGMGAGDGGGAGL